MGVGKALLGVWGDTEEEKSVKQPSKGGCPLVFTQPTSPQLATAEGAPRPLSSLSLIVSSPPQCKQSKKARLFYKMHCFHSSNLLLGRKINLVDHNRHYKTE